MATKKDDGRGIAVKCAGCSLTCKQFASCTVVYCPKFKPTKGGKK